MKGQGALEYLMTYGWALLIIVVVGAALYSLGILNPSTYTQSTCTGFQYFQFRDQKVNGTEYNIEVLSGNRDITLTAISFDGNALSSITPSTAQSAGTSFVINAVGTPTTKSSGETFSANVVIIYDVTNGISGNTDTGTCTGRVA